MSTLGIETRDAYRPRPLIPALDRFYDPTLVTARRSHTRLSWNAAPP